MAKIDFKKELKHLYNASTKEVELVDVPPLNYLMIDGEGNPNTAQAYQDAVETLYMVSYGLKFMVKKSKAAIDYGVMPLEGLWWVDDMAQFSLDNRDIWKWTAMIMQPQVVTPELVAAALAEAEQKKQPPALTRLRFESFHEGLSAQIMHLGPYAAEAPTIEKLHRFIEEQGFELHGKHHEIYLSDPRRSAPEKLKTIIRQPIRPLLEGL
jgi:hypothetical protein